MNDFYVGYLPKAPIALARFVRKAVIGLGLLAVTVALLLVHGQMPFANSAFEYGKVRSFEGTLVTDPYPTLLVARPGQTNQQEGYSQFLLVAPGKHGAGDLVAGLAGKRVRLQGQLIYRDGKTMVEIMPGSITSVESRPPIQLASHDLGAVTVTGEIVDSKCYLGVMNPGSGKVHRDCAARCLSGGVPTLFATNEFRGEPAVLQLADSSQKPLPKATFLDHVGPPVRLKGTVVENGDTLIFEIDPSSITQLR